MSRLAARTTGRLSHLLEISDETVALALDIAALKCVEHQEAQQAEAMAEALEGDRLEALANAACRQIDNEVV